MKRPALPLLLPALLAITACDRTKEPDPAPKPPRAAADERVHPRKAVVDRPNPSLSVKPPEAKGPTDVDWDAPAAWPKVEIPNPMRKATYRIPKVAPDADDGELTVTQAGGTLDQNVKRWSGQFDAKPGDVKRMPRRVGDLTVTVVEIKGTYTPMAMPGTVAQPPQGPKPGYALLGAIVDTSPMTFFKLTGPEKTVAAAQKDFDKLVDGLRAK
jgi:hypothetical protein